MIKRLDKRLMHEVRKLVRRDVQSANKIRAHLQEFVEQKVRPLPSKTDSAYYPSLNIVRGHMNRAQRTLKMAMYDPEGIDILVSNQMCVDILVSNQMCVDILVSNHMFC